MLKKVLWTSSYAYLWNTMWFLTKCQIDHLSMMMEFHQVSLCPTTVLAMLWYFVTHWKVTKFYSVLFHFFWDDTILLKLFYLRGDSFSYDLWLGGWPKSGRASHLSLRTKFALTDDRDEIPAGNEKEALYFLTFSTAVNLVVVTVLGFLPPHPPFLLRSLWRYIAILYVLT